MDVMTRPSQQYAAAKAYGIKKDVNIPSYLEQEVLSWDKEKIILKMYDLFIVSNKRGDISKMGRVLVELMGSLNFDFEETATRLYRLYEYCQRCIYQKKYEESLRIVQELRTAWAKAYNFD